MGRTTVPIIPSRIIIFDDSYYNVARSILSKSVCVLGHSPLFLHIWPSTLTHPIPIIVIPQLTCFLYQLSRYSPESFLEEQNHAIAYTTERGSQQPGGAGKLGRLYNQVGAGQLSNQVGLGNSATRWGWATRWGLGNSATRWGWATRWGLGNSATRWGLGNSAG